MMNNDMVMRVAKKAVEMFPPNFIKIFVDMDQVLTDWDGAVLKLTGEKLEWDDPDEKKQKVYKAIDDAGVGFWRDMPWLDDTAGGKALWKVLIPFRPVLLSSPGEFYYAEQGKREWIEKNVPGTSLYLCQSPDKKDYAERDAVLIDDMEEIISAWQKAGGIGILHKDTESTKVTLLSLLAPHE